MSILNTPASSQLAIRTWPNRRDLLATIVMIMIVAVCGCGTIREKRATEQLLLSDAVDRSVANIDFSPLAGEKVYLDTRFLQFKNESAISTDYVISALRQQMLFAACLLQDNLDAATYVVEARVGTLGADGHEVNYGVPANNALNAAASLVSSSAALPALPEISLGKRTASTAAAKIAVFAYERETRHPVWQSGTSLARSAATGTWVLGAGPFQRGSIYDGTQFAGGATLSVDRKEDDLLTQDLDFREWKILDPTLQAKMQAGDLSLPQVELPGDHNESIANKNEEHAR